MEDLDLPRRERTVRERLNLAHIRRRKFEKHQSWRSILDHIPTLLAAAADLGLKEVVLFHPKEWGDVENTQGMRIFHACQNMRLFTYREDDRLILVVPDPSRKARSRA